jgi:hypothetical protein
METASFCGQCGTSIPVGNKFCTKCGTPSGIHQAITPAMAAQALAAGGDAGAEETHTQPLDPVATPPVSGPPTATGTLPAYVAQPAEPEPPSPPAAPSPPPPRSRGKKQWAIVGGAGAALAVAAIVLVVLVTGGSDDPSKTTQAAQGPSDTIAYQEQIAKAFGPVLGANKKISARLESLKGTKPDSARLAVQQAKEATTAASGAISALTVPDGERDLANAAQEVINREQAYLSAVEAVLNHPTVAGASQLQTLSSDLIGALHAAGPTVAGEEETVSGADRLQTWARTTSRTLARRAAAKRKTRRERAGSGSGSSSSGGGASAPARGNPCGGGVYAGPNTSCPFALNVRDAYMDAPGSRASVRVFSSVTGTTYTMDCRPAGNAITCSGGNGASVTIE